MPCLSTLFRWRRDFAKFKELMQLGMRIRGERFCDQACEVADEATPETAYLAHVRLTHLRWSAGVMAPRVYRPRLTEPEQPPKTTIMLTRHFQLEKDPQSGKHRVVAYCPNPYTGQMERRTRRAGCSPAARRRSPCRAGGWAGRGMRLGEGPVA